MVINPFLGEARAEEVKAYKEEAAAKRGGRRVSEKTSLGYKKAGELYEKVNAFDRAESNYKDAVKYAPEKDKGELRKKLLEVQEKKKETSKLFHKMEMGGLEKSSVLAALAIGSFVIALFFISFSLTGYAIGELTQENFGWISTSLFILGLVFAFFYFKNKE